METSPSPLYTAFLGHAAIATGALPDVLARLAALPDGRHALVLDHLSGEALEVGPDFSPSASHPSADTSADEVTARPGRGRPRLGVVPREVTLLPRHWDWLAQQPGGASAALRRLVDEARKSSVQADAHRKRRDGLYKAMSVLGGNFPRYEEAIRALFADDLESVAELTRDWPADVAAYVSGRIAEMAAPAPEIAVETPAEAPA